MVGALAACVPCHYTCQLLRLKSPWPRLFLRWLGWIAGLRVERVGTPQTSHVLYLANHVSWLDIMLLAGRTGCAFVSKQEVADWPIAGWLARLNKTIFIARAERGAVRGQADTLRDALVFGAPVALFPEGTTNGGFEILPFRASLLASLFPPIPDLTVQPVAIDYHAAAHDIAWIEESAGANALRILRRPGTIPVTLRFLAPIDPAASADRKALASAARDEIVAAMLAGSPDRSDRQDLDRSRLDQPGS